MNLLEILIDTIQKYISACDCSFEERQEERLLFLGLTGEKLRKIVDEFKEITQLDLVYNPDWFYLKDIFSEENIKILQDSQALLELPAKTEQYLQEIKAIVPEFQQVSEDVFRLRENACFTCEEHYDKVNDTCTYCSCQSLHKKILIPNSICPIGRWNQGKNE